MEANVRLRPATQGDFGFAWKLYAEAVKPHVEPHLAKGWEDSEQESRFATIWHLDSTSVIMSDELPIGWIAFKVHDSAIELENFYVAPEYQQKGVGSGVLKRLLSDWHMHRKPVQAAVLKNTPSKHMFEQLGFKVLNEDVLTLSLERPVEG